MANPAGLFPHVRYTTQARDSGVNNPMSRQRRDDDRHHRKHSSRRSPTRHHRRSDPPPRDYPHRRQLGGYDVRDRPPSPSWSWNALILSVTSMTIFASLFGVFGVALASFAYSDHKVGDYGRARYKLRWAWFCGILGIVLNTAAVAVLLIAMYGISVPKPTFKHYKYWVPPWLLEELGDK